MNTMSLLPAAAHHSGLLDLYAFMRRILTKSQVIILIYHRVSPRQDSWSLEPLSPKSFEDQIKYFHQNYEIIPLDKLIEYSKAGRPFPEKAVVITFDDGYKDNYLYAYPILTKYHAPATIFLTTGHIDTGNLFWWDKISYVIQHTSLSQLYLDELGSYSLQNEPDKIRASVIIMNKLIKFHAEKKDYLVEKLISTSGVNIPTDLGKEFILSWDEIREMSNCRIDFGAHTVNHPILTNLPLERARWEITQSKKDIERRINKQVTAFSYPNGKVNDFNSEIVEWVKQSGFNCAVATSPGKLINPKDNVYQLSRISMVEDFNKSKFRLCGLQADLETVLR